MVVTRRASTDPEVVGFFRDHPSSFFTRREWLAVLEEGFDTPVFCYCLEDNGRIHLALPGLMFNFRLIRMFYSNIPYGGFVGDTSLIRGSLHLFETAIRKDRAHLICIGSPRDGTTPDLAGYEQRQATIHLLPLEGLDRESLWKGYKQRVRRDVRKAEKSGVTVEEISGIDVLDPLFALYRETMRRNWAYLTWTKKALAAIHEKLAGTKEAVFLVARKDGELASGIILLISEDRVYYFFSASSDRFFPYCPNDLLVHEAICLAIDRGKKYFDFMTSREDDTALMKFKEKFGARRQPFCFFDKRLSFLRPRLWDLAWGVARTRTGAAILRAFKG